MGQDYRYIGAYSRDGQWTVLLAAAEPGQAAASPDENPARENPSGTPGDSLGSREAPALSLSVAPQGKAGEKAAAPPATPYEYSPLPPGGAGPDNDPAAPATPVVLQEMAISATGELLGLPEEVPSRDPRSTPSPSLGANGHGITPAAPFVPPSEPGPFGVRSVPGGSASYGAQSTPDSGAVPLRDERLALPGGIGIFAADNGSAPSRPTPVQSAPSSGSGPGQARTGTPPPPAFTGTADIRRPAVIAPGQGEILLRLVNAVRSGGYVCGGKSLPSAQPLRANALLAGAAQTHAQDMAVRGYLSSTSPDGRTLGSRISDSGYIWGYIAENIAAKSVTAEQTLQGWLANESQCANIMGQEYTEAGIGFDAQGRFWVFTLATPMEPGAVPMSPSRSERN
jgi:uncharacterized protein YkwD